MSFPKLDDDFIALMISGEISEDNVNFWKLNSSKDGVELKTVDDVLSNDTTSLDKVCETIDILNSNITDMEQYLVDTDWYIVRANETEKSVPDDVASTRSSYRELISSYREYLTTWETYRDELLSESSESESDTTDSEESDTTSES